MTPELEQSDLQIKSVTAKGVAPKRRASTVSAAMTGYNTMVNADVVGGRGIRFACIAGLFAGFPPMPPSEMERQGMGDMPNLNTREFEAGLLDYCDVTLGVHCGNLQWFEVESANPDPMLKERHSEYLTKCFNEAIAIWEDPPEDGFFSQSGRYILESSIRDMQMGLYNVGINIFRGPIDFRFTTIPTRKVFVPEGTKITLENCSAMYVQDDLSAAQLWGYVRNGVAGWDKEQVTKLLYFNTGANNAYSTERWTYAQFVEWTVENESYMSTDFAPIPIVHQYIQEYNGKISHSIFSPMLCDKAEAVGISTEKRKVFKDKVNGQEIGEPGWLFDAAESKWASNWTQVVSLFSDSVGAEGRYHGAKGWGDRNYDLHHTKNITFTRTLTSAIVNNTPMFQSSGEADKQKLDQVTFTSWAILAPELQIQQMDLRMDIGSMLSASDQLNRIVGENNRKFPIGARSKTGEALTATQVTTDTAKESQFTNLQIVQYRATGLDKLGAEMYRRIAQPASKYPESAPGGKVAKYFRERCEEFGIPENELLKVRTVRANRNSGSGSMPIDLMKGKELLAVATPGRGQRNAQEKIAIALVGSEAASAYVEPLPEQPTELNREINHENLFISDGKVPDVLAEDAHEVHVPMHIQLLSQLQQIVMQIQQTGGVTPENIDDAVLLSAKLTAGIEHTGNHLNFMMEKKPQDGKKPMYEEIVKTGSKILNNLAKMTQGLEEEIKKVAQETQQAQAQQSPEMLKAQMDIQIAQMKAEADIQIQQMKAEAKLAMDAIKSQAKTDQKTADHQLKQGLEAEKTLSAMEQSQAQANQKLMEEAAASQQKLQAEAASNVIDIMAQAAKAEQAANQPKKTE